MQIQFMLVLSTVNFKTQPYPQSFVNRNRPKPFGDVIINGRTQRFR